MQQLFWKKIEVENKKHGRPPKIDENASLTYLIDQNLYLYFGGLSAFNLKDMLLEEKIASPPKTEGISFKIASNKSALQNRVSSPFGGGGVEDYVYLLNPSTYQWQIKKTSGKPPSRRINAYVWYEAPLFFVYGGVTADNKTVSDMYILNTETFVWKRFFYLEGPPGRLHFGFSTQGSRKYLVGGASMPENLLMDDVWQLSFENVAWNTPSLELPGVTWEKLPCENMPALKGHSTLQVSDKELFIYGGYNKQKQCIDLSLLLDTETFEISQLEMKGSLPGPRAYHVYNIHNLICLYGGYNVSENLIKTSEPLNDLYLLNLNEGHWSKPIVGGYVPTPRHGYAISGNQSELHGEIFILGGRLADGSVDQCLHVLHELDIEKGEAWDEQNDEEKNQFESYREAKKENKSVSIPTPTLEFNEAELIIIEQRRQVGEKEKDLKELQNGSQTLQERAFTLQDDIDKGKSQLDIDLEEMRIEIQENNEKADQNQITINNIMSVLVQERKKRKLVQRKVGCLQDVFRKTQQYIMDLDKSFLKGQNDGLLETSINEDILSQIEQRKIDHRDMIIQFRHQFEDLNKKEQHVRQQMKQSKITLTKYEKLNEIYKNNLTKEDREYLGKK